MEHLHIKEGQLAITTEEGVAVVSIEDLNQIMVDGAKVNVMSSIDMMVECLKQIVLKNSGEKLKLLIIIPIEDMEGITE